MKAMGIWVTFSSETTCFKKVRRSKTRAQSQQRNTAKRTHNKNAAHRVRVHLAPIRDALARHVLGDREGEGVRSAVHPGAEGDVVLRVVNVI